MTKKIELKKSISEETFKKILERMTTEGVTQQELQVIASDLQNYHSALDQSENDLHAQIVEIDNDRTEFERVNGILSQRVLFGEKEGVNEKGETQNEANEEVEMSDFLKQIEKGEIY